MRSTDYSGAGWGYPFPWQCRSFYFPPDTPTVVATSFAVEALFHAYTITADDKYKETALSSAQFVLNDLRRTMRSNGFILSYAPIPGNDRVHNASLLGAKILAQCYQYSGDKAHLSTAKQIIQASIDCQSEDGSWVYGMGKTQGWIDNFHTGYNLEAIQAYQEISGDSSFQANIEKGLNFMLNNHFEKNYIPKYYHDRRYPIDIHCCGEIFVVLNKLRKDKENMDLMDGVFDWTINNMWDKRGFFYFQKHKIITNKAPLMRWSQAFMFNALTYYLKSKC
jgi:rhamnogalacturonyl hydrolase YesR